MGRFHLVCHIWLPLVDSHNSRHEREPQLLRALVPRFCRNRQLLLGGITNRTSLLDIYLTVVAIQLVLFACPHYGLLMSFEPLSINAQLALGSANQFPNKVRPYNYMRISRAKTRKDRRQSRKVEAITGRERAFIGMVRANPKYGKTIRNVLRHYYDQSILAKESGQFPSLPKSSVVDVEPPPKGLTYSKHLARHVPSADVQDDLYSSFVPTNFQQMVDLQLTTPALHVAGIEQPYGGSHGIAELAQTPRFVPNAAFGGSRVRYY